MAKPARPRIASAPLAVAAATVALSDAARATTIDETTDFGDSFGESTLLPLGTDVVNGAVFEFEGDASDFITFQGLPAGASFELTALNDGDVDNVLFVSHLDDSGGTLDTQSGTFAQFSGTIPGSGQLNFGIQVELGGAFYDLTLEVPEPATAVLLGGGLLAAAALRRARARRGS